MEGEIKKTPVSELIPTLANKLTIISLRAGTYRYILTVSSKPGTISTVSGSDPEAKGLIGVLALQAVTRLEARLAIDNLELLSLEALSTDILPEALSTDILINRPVSTPEAMSLDKLPINKEKKSILNLIRNA